STPAHPLFYKGMIFTCCSNKGKSLEQFLLYAKIHPSKIIFIDDKLKNLVDIEKLCEKEDIPFLGIQYLKDRRLMQADEKTAKFQIEYFKKNKQWLSDTKAHRRLSDI
ncbi:MAG TPA: DUF2608 domain-containing protein, partial [Chlamydiales bacterium]|nr:DUF2608 domain-containing protein [Chlamydiales bacterium]